MIFASWNVRGLNGPLTLNKVVTLCRQHNISLFGLQETKLKLEKVDTFVFRKLRGWKWISNHEEYDGGRLLVVWNPSIIDCVPLEITAQVIHCSITDKVSSISFICNFVYGLRSIPDIRDLWASLLN